jgi:ADP-heptose:LPS heptosyltransferase
VQKGPARADLAPFADCIEDWSEQLSSFDDSAALFRAVDGIISVCSAPIHLAGALNCQSIALLSTEADWRWGTYEASSPWYPRTQLARQTAAGDWSSLLPQIRSYLADWQVEDALPTICGETKPPASVGVDRHEWLYV